MRKRNCQIPGFWKLIPKAVLTLILAVSTSLAFAANREISGKVVDSSGNPVPGASVVAKGAYRGEITNGMGEFRMNVSDDVTTLEVTFIGYETVEVDIREKTRVEIVLKEASYQMDEVVAIGYGRVRKSSLTAAVSKVDASLIETRPVTNVASALQGQLAGVEVRSTSGDPGADIQIRVRGSASVNADSNPLYIVDGVPVENLQGLNPTDIASIEVLKDASSSAIYGSRGANGVVLVTTKRGNTGKPVIQFSGSVGVQSMEKKLDMLSSDEWMDYSTYLQNTSYMSAYGTQGASINDTWEERQALIGGVNYNYMPDPRWSQSGYGGLALIDWQDEFYRTAYYQDYQLSVSGASENANYFVSGGYLNKEGLAVGSGIERVNLRASVETKVLDRITFGVNVAPSISWQEGYNLVDNKDSQSHKVLSIVPVAEREAGIYTGSEPHQRYLWAGSTISPVAYMEQATSELKTTYIQSNAYLRGDIIDGLVAEITGAWNYTGTEWQQFLPSSVTNWTSTAEGYNTSARHRFQNRNYMLFQATLNYNKTIGLHSFGVLGGYSAEKTKFSESNVQANRFPNNAIPSFTHNNVNISSALSKIDTDVTMLSWFGRIMYDYDSRYLVNASIRTDGSSKFGADQKWGVFPAASVAWRVTGEEFMQPLLNTISNLKIRASYGVTGNNSIPSNAALGVLSNGNYSFGGSSVDGFKPSSSANLNLGWEKTHSWDFGFDLGLFRDRVSVTVDYYMKTTKDLLYKVTVPSVLGYTSSWQNIGEIENKGLDVEIFSRNMVGEFNWTTSFNMGYNKNEVKSLGSNNQTVYTGFGNITQVLQVGEPLYAYYMYDAVGVYQTSADLQNHPVMSTTKVGDVRYRDVDGNGSIDSNDRTLVGSPFPKFTFGLTNNFSYKNFDLSILLTAQTGGKIYGLLGRAIDRPGMGRVTNVMGRWRNMWRSEAEPGDGKTPNPNGSTGSLYDTRWLYSSDFLKIKNVTLGYTIPVKKYIQSARIYVSCENLYMWDDYYGGYSPEINNSSTSNNGMYDYGAYPHAKTFTFGVNLTF